MTSTLQLQHRKKQLPDCLGCQKQDKELFHCHIDAVEQLDSLTAAE